MIGVTTYGRSKSSQLGTATLLVHGPPTFSFSFCTDYIKMRDETRKLDLFILD